MQKTLMIGNVGTDSTFGKTKAGVPYFHFSVATTEYWKDADGAQKEKTEWHKIVAWRHLAEICAAHIKQGLLVYVEGRNETQKWKDDKEVTHYTTRVIAKKIDFLSSLQKGTAEDSGVPPEDAEDS